MTESPIVSPIEFLGSIQQRWLSRKKWKGGIHYIDFVKARVDIFAWIVENSSIDNIRIKEVQGKRDKFYGKLNLRINNRDLDIDDKRHVYKIYFKSSTDFMGFKLEWL